MAYSALTTTETTTGKPWTQAVARKCKDNFDYLYSVESTLAGNNVINGSFEIDADSSGVPDGWSVTLYQDGASVISATDAHGAYSYSFTILDDGGGDGGGYIETTDWIPVSEFSNYVLSFYLWATAADSKNIVAIYWATDAKAAVSTSTVYSEAAANPTTAVEFVFGVTPPATARFCKIRLTGGFTDTSPAADTTIYFDGVSLRQTSAIMEYQATAVATTATRKVGIGTTVPTRHLEINTGAATGGIRISYNDANGSAATYLDITLDSNGDVVLQCTGDNIDFGDNELATTGIIKGIHTAADGTAPKADGTYTVGLGTSTDGTITIEDGIITAVQECADV